MIRISNFRTELDEQVTAELITRKTGIKNIKKWHYHKRSVDARKKIDVHYLNTIDVETVNEEKYIGKKNINRVTEKEYVFPKTRKRKDRPIIIGAGPAGLFAALMLAENGHEPILLERGEAIEERIKSVENFQNNGILNPKSNIQFGEGGAGTFSDGKLTTGIKNIRCHAILKYFVKFGAPEDILYVARPHIGTDILRTVMVNMRKYIENCGGEVHFNTCVEKFIINNSEIKAVVTDKGEIAAKRVILAIGHSARDTFSELYKEGFEMIAKPFSVGVRAEHPQELINKSQYGESALLLGAADYKLSTHLKNGRGVYTFCMCPGGTVVGAASEIGGVVTNGMSVRKRDGENANSALLVGVNPSDFGNNPLDGIKFQKEIEQKAFLYGGGNYFAPAQLVGDFLKNTASNGGGSVSPTYRPGVRWGKVDECLPKFVTDSLREAIKIFDTKIKGFAFSDAVLTAPETRSSSPVRILRNELYMSNIKGVYPCGEGGGYAGGIMSAAADGIECAERLAQNE